MKKIIIASFTILFALSSITAYAQVATDTSATTTDTTVSTTIDTTVSTSTDTTTSTSTDTTVATSTNTISTSTDQVATSTDTTSTTTDATSTNATTTPVVSVPVNTGSIMVGSVAPFMYQGKQYMPYIAATTTNQVVQTVFNPVVTTSKFQFPSNLRFGMKNSDVLELQKILGMSLQTGFFGPITKAAVVKYQSDHDIPTTGFVGPLTRASLNQ